MHAHRDQIPVAQVIRRFRDLDMPLAAIRAVLEAALARTGTAVESLRLLLDAPPAATIEVTRGAGDARRRDHRRAGRDTGSWFAGARAELQATLFLPCDVDRAYGSLAAYVAERALGIDGPIREIYLVGASETDDTSRWRTEIGWPVFQTAVRW